MNQHSSTLSNVAKHYVKLLNVPVTSSTIVDAIEQSPYYPSLYSLSAVFDRFDITNQAFNLGKEEMHNLEAPFVAYFNLPSGGSDFILVTDLSSTHVHYLSADKKKHKITFDGFAARFKNIVFAAEAKETSGEPNYAAKLKEEKKADLKRRLMITGSSLALFSACVLLFLPLVQNLNWINLGSAVWVTAAKLLGVGVVVLLFLYEIDKSNSIVKSICSAGKKTSCDAVLTSKGSKIFGMSWSEIGAYYFLSTSLFLMSPGVTWEVKVAWLALASAVASPYIIFSLFYQWRVIKKWCTLCLLIQAALALEFSWSLANFWVPFNGFGNIFNPQALITILICLLLPMVAWTGLKTLIIKAKQAPKFEAQYKRMLFNPEIFNGLMQLQPVAADGWQDIGITIGNPLAPNTIIKVCNPYCGPCAKAHPVLEEIIHRNKNYKLKVIFTSTDSPEDRGGAVAKHLLAVAAKGDEQQTSKALDDWYLPEKKDYEVFASKYPMNGELKAQSQKIQAMSKWCDDSSIAFTPTIFLNGKRLPETYTLEELKSIL